MNTNLENDCSIRSPHGSPQSDVQQSDFSNSHLGTLRVLIGVGTERSDVHLFRLFPQCLFVLKDCLNDEIVAERDE